MTIRNTSANSLKSALHHWWPRSLSKLWANDCGSLTQLWWDGKEVCSQPATFGAITNAHHIKFGHDSPWNSTFEHAFQYADEVFPDLAHWLRNLDIKRVGKRASFQKRFRAQRLSLERRRQLAECLSSLIVRSPASRNKIRITAEEHRAGLPDQRASKTLIAASIYRGKDAIRRAFESAGKFVVLRTESEEFIFGDGFLHNFHVEPECIFPVRCLVPVLPTVSVLYVQPSAIIYRTHPELSTILLRREEVAILNDIVQIYSRDFVFYRNDKPRVIDEFSRHEFLEFEDDPPALATLIATALEFVPEC
jgi:hypothetical protein